MKQSQPIENGEQCRSWTICLNTVYLYHIVIFLRNKLFQTLISVVIYVTKETSFQQYFALKISTISYSSYPFFRPFDQASNNIKQVEEQPYTEEQYRTIQKEFKD